MRNRFSEKITEMAETNQKLILLSGDIGNRLFDTFKTAAPGRFFNCGVAEQNMMGVASGLAMQGFLPFVYTIAPFCTARCLEQIRIDVAYHNLPVTIIGVGAGLSYANLGPTHHSVDDISFLRSIPNLRIFNPSGPDELEACLELVERHPGPTYIRMGKKGEPSLHKTPPNAATIKNPISLKTGRDICLLSSGTILAEAFAASQLLKESGIDAALYSLPMVKPLPTDEIIEIIKKYSFLVVIEEHSKIGGIGSALSEIITDHNIHKPRLLKFGVPDQFIKCAGSQKYARAQVGMSADLLCKQILIELGDTFNENNCGDSYPNRKAS